MTLSHSQMLDRMYASDDTCNGHFITGVMSTKIYCLPSCSARKPKADNVKFFLTQEDARSAGLRACKRCRPDDFYAGRNPELERLMQLVERIRRCPAEFESVEDIASRLETGVTKAHQLFREHYHLSPRALLSQARINSACKFLLQDASALDAAFDAGFESASAFHENFRKWTGLTPAEYRGLKSKREFVIALPTNYRADVFLRFIGRDSWSKIERTSGSEAAKAIVVGGERDVIHMEFDSGHVNCKLENGMVSTVDAHRIAVNMLGLKQDPAGFERKALDIHGGPKLISGREGLRIPQTSSPFEALCWAIIGQQINLTFASTLRRALAEICGTEVSAGFTAHPTPDQVANLEIGDLTSRQFSKRKAEYLIETSRQIAHGKLLANEMPDCAATQVHSKMLEVRGIGPWSANYFMLRGCGFADCVPLGDSGLRAALKRYYQLDSPPDQETTKRLMEAFAPYRSLATYHLWSSLGDPA